MTWLPVLTVLVMGSPPVELTVGEAVATRAECGKVLDLALELFPIAPGRVITGVCRARASASSPTCDHAP